MTVVTLAVLLVVTMLGQTPAVAQQSSAPWCGSSELVAADEQSASLLARECGQVVEVTSARGFAERVFAEPDGTFTLRTHARPQWALDHQGQWATADATFQRRPDGRIGTVATVVDIAVSPGGFGAFATVTDQVGRSLGLVWPDELPEPDLDGAAATYRDVYDGVDLQVTAGVDWFSYALVVHSRQAALHPELAAVEVGVNTDGLELSQMPHGAVVALDGGGQTVFSGGRAFMWDSSPATPAANLHGVRGGDVPGLEPGKVAEMRVELVGGTLRVVPDQAMLSDPSTRFPVTIDPTFTADRLTWTTVGTDEYVDDTFWDDGMWPRNEGLRIGYQGWTAPGSEGYGRWRSMARFDTEMVRGASINSARVDLTVWHSGGCDGPFPLQLWQTKPIEHGQVPTSWSSTSGHWQTSIGTQMVPSANSTSQWCGPFPDQDVAWSNTTLRNAVQDNARAEASTITLGLRTGNESDRMQWMRAHPHSFTLEINYTPVTPVPNGLATNGVGCLAPVGSRVTGSAPVLSGVPRHSEGQVRARVEVRTATGSVNLHSWLSDPAASGDPVTWQVETPLADGPYRWRMRSEDPNSSTTSAWSGWCGFTVDAVLDTEPDPVTAQLECPVPVGQPLESAHESVALLLAQACDEPAEVTSERDFTTRVFAQPDGNLIVEQFTVPQWARDDEGEWADVDTGLVVDGEGRISTAVAVSNIEVSGGGEGPLVTATDPDGGALSLWWPDPLPAPSIDGDTVTYAEVFDDVDLQVTAGVDGFSYVLVVKSAAAAASSELASVTVGIDVDGLQLAQDTDGVIVAVDTGGQVVFSAPAAYMWDSSEPEPAPEPEDQSQLFSETGGSGDDYPVPGRYSSMPLDLDGTSLTVVPDQGLLTDPEAEFPIKIDPPFSGRRMHWATVHQQQPNGRWTDDNAWPRTGQGGPEMRVGRLGNWPNDHCGSACGLWRSAIRFNVSGLSGRQIISASVKATQTHTSGCGSYGLQLWYVTAFTSGVSWNGLASNWQNQLQSQTLASSNRAGGCPGTSPTGVTFSNSSVRSRVQAHADAGHGSLSFGFRSSDESSINPYRRIAVGSIALEVVYNRPAQIPTNLRTNGQACASSAPGPWLTDPRPTLSGTPRDPDGRVGAHLQVRRIGSSSTFYSWQTDRTRQHNRQVNHRIPAGDRLSSGAYRWRMRSLDNLPAAGASDWNQWCHFRVDVTAPTTPAIELVGDPPQAGEPVTLRLSSSDAHSGLDGFSYGINEEVPRHSKSSSGTTEITFTATESGGRMWVYVWARDKAGNVSNRAIYDFFAARFVEATPAAAWRLDGDGVDDSGHGHELTFGGGAGWENDAAFDGHRSLGFDTTGCVGTGGPVVRTDAEYTVAAWVRLDDNTRRQTLIGAAGQDRLGFYFRYREGTDRWQFLVGDQDAQSVSWASLNSTGAPTVGQWTHLAVRVDPAARHMQLYINGQLDNERDIPWATWHSEGPVRVGCSSRISGHTWDHFDGAIHHVGVWQGLLTPQQIQAAYAGELPAGLTGDWQLRANGTDASAHARSLDIPTGAGWVDDQYGRQASAMQLDGTASAESDGPIVRTDRSFTISAWAMLDDTSSDRVVAAQAGQTRSGFYLRYHAASDRWHFSMASRDGLIVSWHEAVSQAAPQVGQWYHLSGVFDATAGELRLYVDGQLQATVSGPSIPWHADGQLLVGASGNTSGTRTGPMVGVISDVKTWRGALTDEQVAHVYGGNPAVRWLSQWNLDGSGADQRSGNGLTPSGGLFVDYEWTLNRWCLPFSAFGLPAAGAGYAATGGAAVDTDESLTVTAWVRLDSLDGYQTVLSQGGVAQAAMLLQATPDGRWRFAMPQQDTVSPDVVAAESDPDVVQVGQWTHLAGVFDLARGQLRLYVNGELADTAGGVASPWHADGPLYVGVTGLADGTTSQRMHGAVDEVTAWSSTLDPDRIDRMARQDLGVPCF